MDLREQYKKEKDYDCYAYRQDYAGAKMYQDGYSDEYVEWLESKVNVTLGSVSKCQHTWKPLSNVGEVMLICTKCKRPKGYC